MKSWLNENILKYSILSRLPVKSLLRFRCVSRKWSTLISTDPYFIYLQSRLAHGGFLTIESFVDPPMLLYNDPTLTTPCLRPESVSVHINESFGAVRASCGGLLSIVAGDIGGFHIWIGNPILKDWMHVGVPDPSFRNCALCVPIGLAVDIGACNVSYNVVTLDPRRAAGEIIDYRAFVFSSTTQQWQLSKERIMVPKFALVLHNWAPTSVKGSLYWMMSDSTKSLAHGLLWFNPKEDHSGLQPLPAAAAAADAILEHQRIGEWGDRLSYVSLTIEKTNVWYMDDQSCWIKVRSVSISVENIYQGICSIDDIFISKEDRKTWWERLFRRGDRGAALLPFGGGDALLLFLDGLLFSYDLSTGEVRKLEQADCLYLSSNFWFPYKNSLVSLPKH